jgi:hypothetical protein
MKDRLWRYDLAVFIAGVALPALVAVAMLIWS